MPCPKARAWKWLNDDDDRGVQYLDGSLPLRVFSPEDEERENTDEEAGRLHERHAVDEEEDVPYAQQQHGHQTLQWKCVYRVSTGSDCFWKNHHVRLFSTAKFEKETPCRESIVQFPG